jgi:hypothetical protein
MERARTDAGVSAVCTQEMSFPERAFGYGTQQYWAFLHALMSGLQAYELTRERGRHAPRPLPAA